MSSTGKRSFAKLSGMTTSALMKKARKYQQRKQPILRQLRIEKKGVDTDLNLNPIIATTNTNASAFVLNLVQAGNGSWNRVGRKIQLKSVRLRGSILFQYSAVATTSNLVEDMCRMVVVWDKQPNGVLPTYDTIFGRTEQDGTESCDYLDGPKFDNMDRFTVLRDKVMEDSIGATPLTGGTTNLVINQQGFDEFIPLGNRETVFSGQSVPMTIADISTGALYVFFRSRYNQPAYFTAVNSESHARLRYTDV